MLEDILILLIIVGLAELGDKTQIASGLFSARYNSWMVLLGVMAALILFFERNTASVNLWM